MAPAPSFLDVTDFGADPTGASDSTAAFQKALDAAGGVKTELKPEHLCPNPDAILGTDPFFAPATLDPLPPHQTPAGGPPGGPIKPPSPHQTLSGGPPGGNQIKPPSIP